MGRTPGRETTRDLVIKGNQVMEDFIATQTVCNENVNKRLDSIDEEMNCEPDEAGKKAGIKSRIKNLENRELILKDRAKYLGKGILITITILGISGGGVLASFPWLRKIVVSFLFG